MDCIGGSKDLKIFLIGGSGKLGTELLLLNEKIIAPSSKECDILENSGQDLYSQIVYYNPDVIVHAAAYTNVAKAEQEYMRAIEVNILGTYNVLAACQKLNKKLVYISTDYVFDGTQGPYSEWNAINPITKYAKTKASAELMVRCYENSLVIRTSFFGREFPYDKACIDQYSSKDYIDIIAPKILKEINNINKKGIVHVGSQRRSIYDIAKTRKNNVQAIERRDILTNRIPEDTSFK